MLTCNDCNADLVSNEANYGYEDGLDLCVGCYNVRIDAASDEPETMRAKYDIAESQRSALMNKCIDLEKKLERIHKKYLELRIEYSKLSIKKGL